MILPVLIRCSLSRYLYLLEIRGHNPCSTLLIGWALQHNCVSSTAIIRPTTATSAQWAAATTAQQSSQQQDSTAQSRSLFFTVFRIRDVFIQIRIRGSVPLDYGSGSFSFSVSDAKWKFVSQVSLLITVLTDGSVYEQQSSEITRFKMSPNWWNKVFSLIFFACWWKDPDRM
jgi:hypothetical protein